MMLHPSMRVKEEAQERIRGLMHKPLASSIDFEGWRWGGLGDAG